MSDRTDPELPGENLGTVHHDDRTRFYDPDNPKTAFIEADEDAIVPL